MCSAGSRAGSKGRLDAAGFDPREVEQRVHELEQAQGVAVRRLELSRWAAAMVPSAVERVLERSEQQCERRSELVAHVRKEGRLRAIELRDLELGSLAFGDVDDRGEHEGPLVRLDGIEPDLHGDLGPVLPQAEEVAPDPHRSGLWIAKEVRSEAGVLPTELRRDQHLDVLVQKLATAVTEQLLGLGVDEDDLALVVDHDHGARARIPRPVGTAPRLFCAP